MRTVPDKQDERIAFFANRLATWAERAAEIGLSADDVAALAAAVEATRAADQRARIARDTARSATLALRAADEAMAALGARALAKIRTTALEAGEGVYPAAHIPAPAEPSAIAAPGQPTNFTVGLRTLGWLELSWQCKQPRGAAGTMYQVRRSLDGGPFAFLGVVGKKAFVDRTLPPGTAQVTYAVQAIRSTRAGDEAQHRVYLGVPEGHPAPMQGVRAA